MPLDKLVPLPRPASGRNTTPTSHGPDGPTAQGAPALRLAQALAGAVAPERQASLAEELLSRLDGGHLSLRWMEGADRDAVYALPAPAWAALNEAAHGGIHAVDLPTPRDNQQLGRAIEGLNQLTGLRTLNLPVPETGVRIHLHALTQRDEALSVQLDCWRPAGWRVTAPAGLKVETRGLATRLAHTIKPTSQRADADGKAQGPARALNGIVYFNQPKDHKSYQNKPQDPRAWAGTQDELLATNLNGLATFQESKASAPHTGGGAKPHGAILCRHLALQWLADHGSAHGLSYRHYAATQDIREHVSEQTEDQYLRLRQSPATALFQIDRLGEALQGQFGAMKPGERRKFLIVSESHAMAMELQFKPARKGEAPAYVVAFYDPNVTVSHERVALDSLAAVKSLSLRTFIAGVAEHYFDPTSAQVAQLYRVDMPGTEDDGAASAERLVGLSEQDHREPGLLHHAMRAGQTPAVVAFVREALGDAAGEAAKVRLAGAIGDAGALMATLSDGHPDTPAAYAATLLETPAPSLTSGDRHALLMHAYQAPGSAVRVTPMAMALWAKPTVTSAFVRCVLAADRNALGLPQALDILSGAGATGRPPLASVAMQTSATGGSSLEGIRQSLYNFVHEVVAANLLPDDDKLTLVAARTAGRGPMSGTLGPSAAADAMQRGAPAVAAAMVCAVLEAPATKALQQSLLKALDVDLDELLQRLAKSTESDAPNWQRRIAAGLSRTGLPAPLQAPLARSLLQADTFAALDRTTHPGSAFKDAGLCALRLDSNPSLMVCTAQREIAGLEGYRLRTGTRQGVELHFDGIRYLLPLARLRPMYEQTPAQAKTRPWVDAQETAHPALLAGQMLQHTQACLEHVRLALESPKGPHDDLALRRWLLSRPLNDGPMLHAMATSPTSHAPAGKRAQAFHAFIGEIVRSDRLGLADKCDLLKVGHAFDGGFGTAAQAAIAAGRPDVAAAMACAILESGRPDRECAELLKALGVKLPDTLRAPAPGKGLEPGDWSARLLDGVQKIKLPEQEVVLPVLLRAGELGLGLKLSSKAAPKDQKHAS